MISKQIPIQFSSSENQISLKKIEIKLWHGRKSIIDDFLYRYHYLGSIQGWKFCFVVMHYDEIIGVITLGRPIARMEDKTHTLELTRLCFKHRIPNLGSFVLAKILKHIKRKTTYKRIISYADLSIHTGIIYLAANFKLVQKKNLRPRKGKGWLNRIGRNCIHGNTPKAKFEYLL